jgi:WS/DGAT/MGAT family acyltransferase
MADAHVLERLSAADIYALLGDDFGWPWDIGALAIVDGSRLLDGEGRFRIDTVRKWIEPRLDAVPRLRQLLYRPRRGLGGPLWVDAQVFDIADHVRVHPLPAMAGEGELLDGFEQLRRRPLDSSRPLWELWFLPGLPDRRVGMFMRMHHAIADGVAGVAVFGALLDIAPDVPDAQAPETWSPAPLPSAAQLLRDNARRRWQSAGRVMSRLAQPRDGLRRLRVALPVWREIFTEQRAPHTSLNRPIGQDRRLGIVRSRLDVTKQIAHARHATVNDVVLAAVAAGLRELLASRGEPVDGMTLRAMVPISMHHEQQGHALGNLNAMMIMPLTLREPDHSRRLELIAAETVQRKRKTRPQAMTTGIFRLTFARRAMTAMAAHNWLFNLSITNVPGPPLPLYIAGAPLLEVFPLVPIVGNQTLSVGVLSYAGQLNLTAVADRDSCPDLNLFIQGLARALDELTRPGSDLGLATSA